MTCSTEDGVWQLVADRRDGDARGLVEREPADAGPERRERDALAGRARGRGPSRSGRPCRWRSALVRRSRSSDTAWMTTFAASRPAAVTIASPTSRGAWRTAANSIASPPARLISPAMPADIHSDVASGAHDGVDLEVADVPIPELDARQSDLPPARYRIATGEPAAWYTRGKRRDIAGDHLVADRPASRGEVDRGDPLVALGPDQHELLVLGDGRPGDVGDVRHHRVHRHAAHERHPDAAHEGDAARSECAAPAVAVADREGGDPRRPLRDERRPVATRRGRRAARPPGPGRAWRPRTGRSVASPPSAAGPRHGARPGRSRTWRCPGGWRPTARAVARGSRRCPPGGARRRPRAGARDGRRQPDERVRERASWPARARRRRRRPRGGSTRRPSRTPGAATTRRRAAPQPRPARPRPGRAPSPPRGARRAAARRSVLRPAAAAASVPSASPARPERHGDLRPRRPPRPAPAGSGTGRGSGARRRRRGARAPRRASRPTARRRPPPRARAPPAPRRARRRPP